MLLIHSNMYMTIPRI